MDRPLHPDDPDWNERERYWRRKLGRIRLGVEPVEDQLERYRRVTLLLTLVPGLLAAMFVSLFAAFGRPGVGAVFAAVFLLPIVLMAWLDYALLRSRTRAYLTERDRLAS